MKKNNHQYILIMAGGSGNRLFPRSTEKLPKQFQKIIGEKTLIEQAYERAIKIVDDDHIFISSNHRYVDLIRKYLPNIPTKNYITEPVKRNTGPAIALANSLIYKKDPKAIILSVHSDHLVDKFDEYIKAIETGLATIRKNPNYILCVGIQPLFAHTGLGYIEKGKKFDTESNFIIYKAKRFVEKPSLNLAKEYFSSGNFFWNAGYFIWQSKHFIDELKNYNLDIYDKVDKISQARSKNNYLEVLNTEFTKMDSIAIDHLIMEKTKNLLVLPADIGWSDIGSWDVVADINLEKGKDIDGNYKEGNVLTIDTHNTTILSHDNKKIIATIGLDNFIIITTKEAIVIVPRGRSEEIKNIVAELDKLK
jgi:mannose-1-phosphate guanylyltransferase